MTKYTKMVKQTINILSSVYGLILLDNFDSCYQYDAVFITYCVRLLIILVYTLTSIPWSHLTDMQYLCVSINTGTCKAATNSVMHVRQVGLHLGKFTKWVICLTAHYRHCGTEMFTGIVVWGSSCWCNHGYMETIKSMIW